MLDEVVIKKKDLYLFAKDLLKEIYAFFQNDYITESFPEMKEEKTNFLNRLVFKHILYLNKKGEKENEIHKQFLECFFNKKEFEQISKLADEAIKYDCFGLGGIYFILNELTVHEQIDDDLMFKKEAFINLYGVFYIGHEELLKYDNKTPSSKISYILREPIISSS